LKRSKQTKQRFLILKYSWETYVRQKVNTVTCISF
jgi:hypothetical protein